jgi:molybdopterin-containing oxidoreductase family molybdopterin binding subunit
MDVYIDVANRCGVLDKFNAKLNDYYGVTDPELTIKPGEVLTWKEIGERFLKWVYGKDTEKIKEQGYATWNKPIEDVYWRWDIDTRCPVYMEYLLHDRKRMEEIFEQTGFDLEFDMDQYSALPSWFWPESHKDLDSEFDLIAFSYRDILHTNNTTFQNPYIDEVSKMCPYTFTITLNSSLAKEKGMKDGDVIWIETKAGVKENGIVKTMEAQSPKVIGIAGQGGLWADGRPIAKGKGSNFCKLLPSKLKYFDPVAGNMETAVAVKIYKD